MNYDNKDRTGNADNIYRYAAKLYFIVILVWFLLEDNYTICYRA